METLPHTRDTPQLRLRSIVSGEVQNQPRTTGPNSHPVPSRGIETPVSSGFDVHLSEEGVLCVRTSCDRRRESRLRDFESDSVV